jgi:hypothetical protein
MQPGNLHHTDILDEREQLGLGTVVSLASDSVTKPRRDLFSWHHKLLSGLYSARMCIIPPADSRAVYTDSIRDWRFLLALDQMPTLCRLQSRTNNPAMAD